MESGDYAVNEEGCVCNNKRTRDAKEGIPGAQRGIRLSRLASVAVTGQHLSHAPARKYTA
jgi:hypothetical protein